MSSTLRPTPMDLTLHHMAQTRPSPSMTVGAALHLDGAAPRLADLRTHITAHLHRLPRLTHYLKGPGLRARWAHEPNPDLESRIRERRTEPGEEKLETALRDLLTHPLPSDGPLWDLWLLHGHTPGRYVLCYRAHHTSHDGGGMLNTLIRLFGTSAAGAADVPASTAGLSAYARTFKGMLGSFAHNDIWNDPERPLHGNRVNTWVEVPTAALRTVGAARGGSSNDAVLAALAGALRTWSSEYWPRAADRPVPAVVMVDLRRPGEEQDRPGNLFTFAPISLPCQQPTRDTRLDAVIAATRALRSPAQRNAMRTMSTLTPARVFHALATRLSTPSRAIIDTSHVSLHQPMHYQGNPVTGVQPLTWLPLSHPISIAACSYSGVTTVHFVIDQALPEPQRIPVLWKQAATRPGVQEGP
ncbi:DUF1298 domain-containing protein [Streptomyces sp. b94]|uniref:wax ester/triacylglycerol synthase domain-containing protein n=1 Tax=Streptomyces sp. b94 TaxID=1827634 RepID=UPI001B35A993|nr:wax ester/triacylglycerol synthase domain-containing protein [Streptomyces sp. b94]MBQ1096187.1 DUF1298 domain-containing protein [Streptomyces sp. b94]